MFMIVLVLDDPDKLIHVLEGWDKAGIRGATIIESTGINRHLGHVIPMRYLFQTAKISEEGHLTLFAVVATQSLVEAGLAAVESVTGDLDLPHTGMFAAFPIIIAKGIASSKEEA